MKNIPRRVQFLHAAGMPAGLRSRVIRANTRDFRLAATEAERDGTAGSKHQAIPLHRAGADLTFGQNLRDL
jgi:hypothetical protein